MNNMDSMNDGPDDTNDIGDMSAFLDWTFASTLEPTDSQISTFVGNGYGSSCSQNMMAHYRLEEPYAGVASNSATDNAAYCGGQTLAPTAINDQVFLVEERHEQYQLPVNLSARAINAVLPRPAAPRVQSMSAHRNIHSPTANNDSEHVAIGIILSNGEAHGDRYQCNARACSGITFGRLPDLKRHHASLHGGVGRKGHRTWCPVDGCSRSKSGIGRPFPRKDKMMDHLMRMHPDRTSC